MSTASTSPGARTSACDSLQNTTNIEDYIRRIQKISNSEYREGIYYFWSWNDTEKISITPAQG